MKLTKEQSNGLLTYIQVIKKIKWTEKMKIKHIATNDVKNGSINPETMNDITKIAYIDRLIHDCLKTSSQLWTTVTKHIAPYKEHLENEQNTFDNLLKYGLNIKKESKIKIDQTSAIRSGNDSEVNATVLNRRVNRRVNSAKESISRNINNNKVMIKAIQDDIEKGKWLEVYNSYINQGRFHQQFYYQMLAAKVALYFQFVKHHAPNVEFNDNDIKTLLFDVKAQNKSEQIFEEAHPEYIFNERKRYEMPDFLHYLTLENRLSKVMDES